MTNYPSSFNNPDGSMTPEYREYLRNKGVSEDEINTREQISMRHAAVDKEQAYWKEKHKKDGEEWDRQYEAKKREKERLGIKPGFKVLYSSPDNFDPRKMTPAKRIKYEMSGLSTEELLSQGYIDLDDLVNNSSDYEDDDSGDYYVNPNPPPEIPF